MYHRALYICVYRRGYWGTSGTLQQRSTIKYFKVLNMLNGKMSYDDFMDLQKCHNELSPDSAMYSLYRSTNTHSYTNSNSILVNASHICHNLEHLNR